MNFTMQNSIEQLLSKLYNIGQLWLGNNTLLPKAWPRQKTYRHTQKHYEKHVQNAKHIYICMYIYIYIYIYIYRQRERKRETPRVRAHKTPQYLLI